MIYPMFSCRDIFHGHISFHNIFMLHTVYDILFPLSIVLSVSAQWPDSESSACPDASAKVSTVSWVVGICAFVSGVSAESGVSTAESGLSGVSGVSVVVSGDPVDVSGVSLDVSGVSVNDLLTRLDEAFGNGSTIG